MPHIQQLVVKVLARTKFSHSSIYLFIFCITLYVLRTGFAFSSNSSPGSLEKGYTLKAFIVICTCL